MIDVRHNDLDNNHEGNGEEHSCGTEDLAAEDDAENDGNGVEVESLSDKGGIDNVVIDLCQ